MVKIRLTREGSKGRPFYRVVVVNARASRQGPYIEALGFYHPLSNPPAIVINEERALFWLRRGAQPTETVARLLTQLSILDKFRKKKE